MTTPHKAILGAAGAIWLIGVGTGLVALWRYEVTPNARAEIPKLWPSSSQLGRNPDLFTLVMAAHPHCPCTRASIDGLARIMSRLSGRVQAYVLVLKPNELPEAWEKTEVWRSAARVPGVSVVADVDGREASRFQAKTSGQTVVYEPGGRLVFDGGLTAARGHAGRAASQDQVVALVEGRTTTPVVGNAFGCGLGLEPETGR